MSVHIRKAGAMDARNIAELLNEIIAIGGTTAYVYDKTAQDIVKGMQVPRAAWTLAENEAGQLLGFQWIEPPRDGPDHIADIATFVLVGGTGLGVGSALFEATRKTAATMGYRVIDAIIRADNESGLAYYQSRNFETLKVIKDAALDDGTRVDKIWKRYNLKR